MFMDSVILIILKKSVFPKFVYKFSVIPIQLPENYFLETDKLILKFLHFLTTLYSVSGFYYNQVPLFLKLLFRINSDLKLRCNKIGRKKTKK